MLRYLTAQDHVNKITMSGLQMKMDTVTTLDCTKLEFNLLFWMGVKPSSHYNSGTQNVFVNDVFSRRLGDNKKKDTGTEEMCIIRKFTVCTFTRHSKHDQINKD
jgi:hypothetical protein